MGSFKDFRKRVITFIGPFYLYLFLAVALNLYPFIATTRAAVEYNGDVGECHNAMVWLYINAALCVLHVLMAFYIAVGGCVMVKHSGAIQTAITFSPASSPKNDEESQKETEKKQHLSTPELTTTGYIEAPDVSGGKEDGLLDKSTGVAVYIPTTADVMRILSTRILLRLYGIILTFFLCWTVTGLKRQMMNAGYCGGNVRMHVADSVLCAVLFLVLGQGALVFGAWRAAVVIGQGRVSGLTIPAAGVET